jgi:methylamine---glutamate N-methyltransferase subunit A
VGKVHGDSNRVGPQAVLGLSALKAPRASHGKGDESMCGIAGLIHRGKTGDVGREMTAMLLSLKHRGPDSTGYALYAKPHGKELVIRFKVAEQDEMSKGFAIQTQVKERRAEVARRLGELGAQIIEEEEATPYAFRVRIRYEGDQRRLADYIEDVEGAEILSIGYGLELIKDLGDAERVASQYSLGSFIGTHAIGHTRMATESDVDIRSAHPYWAYPFADVSVVHNGQLTNYWKGRRALERRGHRFVSNCDSELIAVYLADRMAQGATLKDAMKASIEELDGVFTYLVATSDSLGMAKDVMAAKPMVLYESDRFIALASEEVAIRSVFPHEIDTFDPYEGEVRVWRN